ncbi:MAG: hypothetical protein OEX11_03520, partial [Nitrosomonas sp.]|nr:hypothetical protein [Nitrosomonas sp.]
MRNPYTLLLLLSLLSGCGTPTYLGTSKSYPVPIDDNVANELSFEERLDVLNEITSKNYAKSNNVWPCEMDFNTKSLVLSLGVTDDNRKRFQDTSFHILGETTGEKPYIALLIKQKGDGIMQLGPVCFPVFFKQSNSIAER